MKIPIIFLGTGQAIPTIKRNHTSILLKYKQENLLFDCGEGTQRQFRKAKQSLSKTTRLLVTHWHGDHILGIPGLLQTLQLSRYPGTLKVYGPKATKNFMELMQKLFIHQGRLKLEVKEIRKGKVFETPDFYVEALSMKHQSPCLAYSFIEKNKIRLKKDKIKKLKLSGKLLAELAKGKNIKYNNKIINAKEISYLQKGRKISMVLDTAINKNAILLSKDSDLLISEATYSEKESKLAKEYKHLTARQAAIIAKKAKVKKLILIHLSQRHEKDTSIILKEAKEVFKNTSVAEDLDILEI